LKLLHKDKFAYSPRLYGSTSPINFDKDEWESIFRTYDELVKFFQSAEDKQDIILISFN
jgi:hypothetical protein